MALRSSESQAQSSGLSLHYSRPLGPHAAFRRGQTDLRRFSWFASVRAGEMAAIRFRGRRELPAVLPARAAPVTAFHAMHHPHSVSAAVARAAFFVSLLSSPVLARTAEPLIDPHILSSAPFRFQADRGIFSRLSEPPSDSRIMAPRESLDAKPSSQSSQTDSKRQKLR
ncbi:hypothetical protein [Caballeronia concitans]|uniref:hypothetical protein n=1 Tax=Caballeronia concitans TaxID=1777133 RepID=UPI00117DBBD8|nr:hypothetical protein [Caballeronia concitans]